jgi:hypothetical protein
MKHNTTILLLGTTLIAASLLVGSSIATFPNPAMLAILVFGLVCFLAFSHVDIILCFLVMSMLLSPEIVVGQVPGHDIIIRIEDFIIILLGIILIASKALRKDEAFLAKTPLNFNIVMYVFLFVVLTGRGMIIAGVQPLNGMFFVLKYLEYFMIYFLTTALVKRKGQVKLLLIVLLLTFAIVNVYALTKIGHDVRVTAPFEGTAEPNTLGGYQVLMLAIVIGLFLHTRSGLLKLTLAGLVLLTIPPFLFTLSRSSYMAMLPMYLTFFFIEKSKRVILLGGILLAVICALLFMPEKVTARIKYTFEPLPQSEVKPVVIGGVELESSASARIRSWQEVLKEWKKQSFFGYGVTGKGFLDGQYMKTLIELGTIGFLAFVFLLGAMYRHTLRIYYASKDTLFKGLAIGFLAGHVGMMFHAITANTYIIIRIMEPYWFLAAMVMVLPQIEERERKKEAVTEQPAVYDRVSIPELLGTGTRM